MRTSPILSRAALVACSLGVVFVVSDCSKHENFPAPLNVTVAPVPEDFVINSNGLNAESGYDYDLTWTTPDPAAVDHYRLYLVYGPNLPAEFLTDLTGNQYQFSLPANAVGLQFGLSAVSTDNVESDMNVQTVPPVQVP